MSIKKFHSFTFHRSYRCGICLQTYKYKQYKYNNLSSNISINNYKYNSRERKPCQLGTYVQNFSFPIKHLQGTAQINTNIGPK